MGSKRATGKDCPGACLPLHIQHGAWHTMGTQALGEWLNKTNKLAYLPAYLIWAAFTNKQTFIHFYNLKLIEKGLTAMKYLGVEKTDPGWGPGNKNREESKLTSSCLPSPCQTRRNNVLWSTCISPICKLADWVLHRPKKNWTQRFLI